MISSELELSHLDARHWRNGWRLLVPPRVLDAPAWALVVVDRAPPNVISVVIAGKDARGRLTSPPPLHAAGPETLAAYAKQLGVGSVIVIDQALIAQLSAEIEGALQFEADGVMQALHALKALKHHAGKGVWTEPPLLDLLPTPSYEPIQRTFDLLVPDRSALLAYVIEDDRARVHTSIIATKEGGDITRAATHRALADLVPESAFARDWPQQYKRVLAATEERFAKPCDRFVPRARDADEDPDRPERHAGPRAQREARRDRSRAGVAARPARRRRRCRDGRSCGLGARRDAAAGDPRPRLCARPPCAAPR